MPIRESESQTSGDFSSVFSMALSRSLPNPFHCQGSALDSSRWPSLTTRNSIWTKYCLLCTACGTAATVLAAIFLIIAALLRYHTTSIYYFETVPTYLPSILLSICGVSTIAFSCKRNRNIILLRITACWSLVSAALSSVITITTSLIHMNRLQTLKECVYTRNPPSCTCFGHFNGLEGASPAAEPHHFVFENTADCDVIHGVLYSCLRAVFATSVVAVLLSIFLCMLLHQLIGHERKKAYWTRIRRINSDWSSDFLSCLARPLPSDRSVLPLITSSSRSTGIGLPASCSMVAIGHNSILWGPPPPYQLTDLRHSSELTEQSAVSSTASRLQTVPQSSTEIEAAHENETVSCAEPLGSSELPLHNGNYDTLQPTPSTNEAARQDKTVVQCHMTVGKKTNKSLPATPQLGASSKIVRRCNHAGSSGRKNQIFTQSLPSTPRRIVNKGDCENGIL